MAINPALAVLASFICCETDEEAVEKGVESGGFFGFALHHYYAGSVEDPHLPAKVNLYKRYKDTPPEKRVIGRGQFRGQLGGLALQATGQEPTDENARALWRSAQGGGCIGSPDYIRKHLRQYEEAHLDVMVLIAQSGDRKHDDIMKSLKLFAKEVMPEFKERHEAHQKWRQEQLHGVPYPISSSI